MSDIGDAEMTLLGMILIAQVVPMLLGGYLAGHKGYAVVGVMCFAAAAFFSWLSPVIALIAPDRRVDSAPQPNPR